MDPTGFGSFTRSLLQRQAGQHEDDIDINKLAKTTNDPATDIIKMQPSTCTPQFGSHRVRIPLGARHTPPEGGFGSHWARVIHPTLFRVTEDLIRLRNFLELSLNLRALRVAEKVVG